MFKNKEEWLERVRMIQENRSQQESQNESDEPLDPEDTRTEAKRRIDMAKYYSAIIDNGIFGEDSSDIAQIVDHEMKEFASERMQVLLGMIPDNTNAPQNPFTDSEIKALKLLAASAMKRLPESEPIVKQISIQDKKIEPVMVEKTPKIKTISLNPAPKIEKENKKPVKTQKSMLANKKTLARNEKPAKVGGVPHDALPMPTGQAMTIATATNASASLSSAEKSIEGSLISNAIVTALNK